ncbi:MAG: glutathione S-transferase family protein [Gammaproteobacteria bacterium AqS3]|nr:glutathione S-transferase family protein [Gammaproteobacteria bacterium AqS3]
MKLYSSIGPNPRVILTLLKEGNIDIPIQEVDLLGGENRREPYTSINPGGQLPALELDSGLVIAEVLAVGQYLDATHGAGLFGEGEQLAETLMWYQRVQLEIIEPMANSFRYGPGLETFKDRMHCIPEAAPGLAEKAKGGLKWLDGLIAGREWIIPDRYSFVDLYAYCLIDFFAKFGQPLDGAPNVEALLARVGQRPAAQATA